jgi:hypothetical protein
VSELARLSVLFFFQFEIIVSPIEIFLLPNDTPFSLLPVPPFLFSFIFHPGKSAALGHLFLSKTTRFIR